MKIELFYNKETNEYFTNKIHPCQKCQKEIRNIMIRACSFWGKGKRLRWYCESCWKGIKELGVIDTYKVVNYAELIPFGSYPVFDNVKPDLKNGKDVSGGDISVFEAEKIKSENTIDKTKLANRQSCEGAKIGKPDFKALEDKDKPLDDEGVKKLLNIQK